MAKEQTHAGDQQYDKQFFQGQRGVPRMAEIILSVAKQFIRPQSVVDVGCGLGGWLATWQKICGVGVYIYGMDGDYVDRSQMFIDEKFFHVHNLEKRINLGRRFDLAMNLEVAEHLSPERADSFVEDLTKLSDVILFGAAIPVQGGTNHINEQWQSYWAEKFLRLDYVAIDCIRPKIWQEDVPPWRCQNTFFYVKSTELYRYPELQDYYLKHRDLLVYDMVHPRLYSMKIMEFRAFYQKVQDYLKARNEYIAEKLC